MVTAPAAPVSVTVDPATVAGPATTVMLTGNPLVAVALKKKGSASVDFGNGWSNVMVCGDCASAAVALPKTTKDAIHERGGYFISGADEKGSYK